MLKRLLSYKQIVEPAIKEGGHLRFSSLPVLKSFPPIHLSRKGSLDNDYLLTFLIDKVKKEPEGAKRNMQKELLIELAKKNYR